MTTHYMDEAERCHRLAFIFGGQLLDVGTPEEIVARREMRAAELDVDRSREAAEVLRALPSVEEVSHFGHLLRVATRGASDPVDLVTHALAAAGIQVRGARPSRVDVEDAFVAMVRADQRQRAAA